MKKAIRICVAIILLVISAGWVFSLWSGLTLFVLAHEEPIIESSQDEKVKGAIVSPLDGLDFDHGEWSAYLVFAPEDFENLKGRFTRNCLKMTDRETMKRMRDEWKMKYTGGDMATVVSHLVILKDDKVVFSSGIIVTEEGFEGLQSSSFGWLEPQYDGAISEYCNKFEPVYWPVIIL